MCNEEDIQFDRIIAAPFWSGYMYVIGLTRNYFVFKILQNMSQKFFYVTKIYILFYENINFMEVFGNNFVLSLGRDIRDSPFSCSVCITVQKHCNLRLSNF